MFFASTPFRENKSTDGMAKTSNPALLKPIAFPEKLFETRFQNGIPQQRRFQIAPFAPVAQNQLFL